MITVTGTSGHLGRLAVEALLDRGVPAGEIVAVARTTAKVADLAALGVQVRHGDYTDPATLGAALAGTDVLVLVSSNEIGQRLPQHRNVIDAAVAAGVGRIVYTSILKADTSGAALAGEHKATEEAIRASGLAFTFLRNGWYLENYTENLAPALEFGAIFGAARDGRVAAATRADYAAAIAVVAAAGGHENRVYELGGDQPFTMAELAAEVSDRSGQQIAYTDLPAGEYEKVLVQAGLPQPYAAVLADSDVAIARGDLTTDSSTLRELIGRPTTGLGDAVALALKA
jgi:NAD(P)H dehydrogenase (quinone)